MPKLYLKSTNNWNMGERVKEIFELGIDFKILYISIRPSVYKKYYELYDYDKSLIFKIISEDV